MTTIFQELVAKERAAEEAHSRVEELRGMYGPPTRQGGWSPRQTETYNTALRAWRDLAREVQVALADYARERGETRSDVEKQVHQAVGDTDGSGAGA
ncbi:MULTISPECIES: hypothetical protein [Streptomyces]|uniref:hypothetical protein n=1 Tax=Streptomyces TaxID=1883 RepID=UPI0004C9CC20|nr:MULTISPECIES: hypothetical protein [unclassified Streptomyces]SED71133.1 hypothetical protein SAMN05216482_8590 [Streptomyces sp. PAN_FS17]SEE78389.1 hypothetical protein SAMN05428938_8675 [Streptomyces sp. KS_5]